MNIKNHSKHVAEHPFMQHAIERSQEGDYSELELILFELQIHTYLECCKVADKTFRKWKDLTPAEIRKELQDMPAPETLNIDLPRPPAAVKKTNFVKRVSNKIKEIANQLQLWEEETVLTL